jgi:outer membrane protein assembly factor BamB
MKHLLSFIVVCLFASQAAWSAEPATRPEARRPAPSDRVVLTVPRAVDGKHDVTVVFYRRGEALHNGYALVPAFGNFVHKVSTTPPATQPFQIQDGRARGSIGVYVFTPDGNYASTGPHQLSGHDRILRLDLDLPLKDGALTGPCRVQSGYLLGSRGPTLTLERTVSGAIHTGLPAPAPTDSLAQGATWPSLLGPNGNASAVDYPGELVDSMSEARLVWVSEENFTGGRSTKLQYLRGAAGLHFWPLEGAYSTPVVAHGLAFQYDMPPDPASVDLGNPAKHEEEKKKAVESGKSYETPADLLARGMTPLFFATRFNLAVTAMDAATGRTVWRAEFPGEGEHAGGKGGGAGGMCVVGDHLVLVTFTGRAKGFDARTGKLLWSAKVPLFDGKTAPMPIGGSIVCAQAYGGLYSFDSATGAERWKLSKASSEAPVPWQHEGREYVLSLYSGDWKDKNFRLFCIDPVTGAIIWEHADVGPSGVTLTVAGDILITNGRAVSTTDIKDLKAGSPKPQVVGYRLSLQGAKRVWELPEEYVMYTYAGSPCVVGNTALIRTETETGQLVKPVVAVDCQTGKVLAQGMAVAGGLTKAGHAGGVVGAVSSNGKWVETGFAVRDLRRGVLDVWRGPFAVGYGAFVLTPIVDGRIFIRSHDRILCYDVRQKPGTVKEEMTLELPAGLFGNSVPLMARIHLRNGVPSHGWHQAEDDAFYGQLLCATGVTGLQWDGRALGGSIAVDTKALWEDFAVSATAADGRLAGTITARVPALEQQTNLTGTVAQVRDDSRPVGTLVLALDQAVRTSADRLNPLELTMVTKGDQVVSVTGRAPRTNGTTVQVDGSGLRLENGRLRGSMVAIFRPDLWVAVYSGAQGQQCVAARYEIDVALQGKDQGESKTEGQGGTYTGQWGVAWERTLPTTGSLRPVPQEDPAIRGAAPDRKAK